MAFEEKMIKSEYVFEGHLIQVRKDLVTTVNGESVREIVDHDDAVAIVALKPDGTIIMERQFRYAAERVVFEIPAGLVDPGEDPETAAIRELREETGYRAGKIRYLTTTYPSIGFANEIVRFYLCTEMEKGETEFDENESIDLEEHPIEEIYKKVMNGEIADSETQIGVLMTMNLIRSGELKDYLK